MNKKLATQRGLWKSSQTNKKGKGVFFLGLLATYLIIYFFGLLIYFQVHSLTIEIFKRNISKYCFESAPYMMPQYFLGIMLYAFWDSFVKRVDFKAVPSPIISRVNLLLEEHSKANSGTKALVESLQKMDLMKEERHFYILALRAKGYQLKFLESAFSPERSIDFSKTIQLIYEKNRSSAALGIPFCCFISSFFCLYFVVMLPVFRKLMPVIFEKIHEATFLIKAPILSLDGLKFVTVIIPFVFWILKKKD